MLQRCGGRNKISAHTWETKESFEEGLFRGSLLIPTVFPHSASRKPAVEPGGQKGGGDVLYQDCESQFPRSVFFLLTAVWLSGAERATGQLGGGMRCGSWNLGTEGLTGRLWTKGCWAITRPRGCLFKAKSCLDCCPQTLLLYCSCMRHKGTELEIGRRRRQGEEGSGCLKEEVWTMSSFVLRKQH